MGSAKPHIVDVLIQERASRLMAKPRLWAAIKAPLYKILGYRRAVKMADTCAPMTGREAFAHLNSTIGVTTRPIGINNIPQNGPLIIIGNHPTGLGDGMFAFDVLQDIRPGFQFLANADALRAVPGAGDLIIPVEWVQAKRTPSKTKATLIAMKRAMREERCLVIFPSGRLGKLTWRGVRDKDWMSTAITFARKNNIPIVPMHIKARNSALFYIFSAIHPELRDVTLFHEMMNKGKSNPVIRFGPAIDPAELMGSPDAATAQMRGIVEGLGAKA